MNPIIDDYKLLLVFKNMGTKLLLEVKNLMGKQPYNAVFKAGEITQQNEMFFAYLDYNFRIGIELFFNHTRMPKSALLATYYLSSEKGGAKEEIISYAFDLDYVVNDIYTLDNFAEHYLVEFHQNVKKSFSDSHTPFSIKLMNPK